MNYEVYHIPTNFTDAGRVMGLFELRNLVEAVILTVPVLYLCIAFFPFDLSTKIMVTLVIVVLEDWDKGFCRLWNPITEKGNEHEQQLLPHAEK